MATSPVHWRTMREELDNLLSDEQDNKARITSISTLFDLAASLEATLEQMRQGSVSPQSTLPAASLQLESSKHESSISSDGHQDLHGLLEDIATAHRERASRMLELHSSHQEGPEELLALPFSIDDIDDALLRWAIASKRVARISDCVNALLKRNELFPHYKVTEAIRFLGCIQQAGDDEHNSFDVLEITNKGIFELNEDSKSRCRPTKTAVELGTNVRKIFAAHNYTLPNCRSFILPFLAEEDLFTTEPIVSANGFFLYRQEILSEKKKKQDIGTGANLSELDSSPLSVLVHLFLFGIARTQAAVEAALGEDATAVLFEAGLLAEIIRSKPSDKSALLIGEVMIYPIHRSDFQWSTEKLEPDPIDPANSPCLFMTDWPVESLRLPRDAVMPIGDDSLELMALASGAKISADSEEEFVLLDMCCGSGIQGIFALCCAKSGLKMPGETSERLRLVSADINQRAMHFVTANLALNTIGVGSDSFAICGDLFDEGFGNTTLRFDRILCNPPFVPDALPECRPCVRLEPARYAVGGGADGMNVLRGFLSMCFNYLKATNYSIFMVTELPNVKRSCSLLRSCIPAYVRDQVQIGVAYVEEDVEQIVAYSKVREEEAGEEVRGRDWSHELSHNEIYDRALVLISISPEKFDDSGEKVDLSGLYKFSSGRTSMVMDGNYEEDAFLSPDGVSFLRKKLL